MIIIAYKPGQLANRLFLFAKFLAYGFEHRIKVINPSFDDYVHYFAKTKRQFIPASKGLTGYSSRALIKLFYKICFFASRIVHRFNIKSKFISVTYLDWSEHYDLDNDKRLCTEGVHFIQGWQFDASKLMRLHKSEIIRFFEPEPGLRHKIEIHFRQFKNSRRIIGVHIRQGDYRFFEDGKYFYQASDYKSIMVELQRKYPDSIFLVCTNNRLISRNDFGPLNVIMAFGHELVDLYLLAKCNYIIGPPSTYSLWASFYGDVPLYQIKQLGVTVDLADFKQML